MLKKLVNWCKKIVPMVGATLLGIGLVVIIVLACIPHGKTYTYELEFAGQKMKVDMIFEGDDLVIESSAAGEFSTATYEYKISDGVLYSYDEYSEAWNYEGKIDAYKLVYSTIDDPDAEMTEGNFVIEMTCKANIALRTVSIVLMVVGGVVLLAAGAVVILANKGIIKVKEEPAVAEISAETVASTPVAEPAVAEPVQESAPVAEPAKEEETNN